MSSSSTGKRTRPATEGMGDLFGPPGTPDEAQALPEGFRYMPDVMSAVEESNLVARFEALPLKPFEFRGYQGNRRIYTFGHKYIFAGQDPRADSTIPDYLHLFLHIASRISGAPVAAFSQVMVTEYAPGAGIGWHLDRPNYEHIVGVSFLAPCALRLRRKADKGWERRQLAIEPRSAYLLSGAARNEWQHSIAPMEVLRYSVTLRTFRPGKDEASG